MANLIKLPIFKLDPEETKDLCKCRPICKSRWRNWRGKLHKTSAELLVENKPAPECLKKYPFIVIPNAPCSLQNKTRNIKITEKYVDKKPHVVRICQAPVDDTAFTPYLYAAEVAREVGALDMVKACCPFCTCGKCCICGRQKEYPLNDADRQSNRRADMRKFDSRVKLDYMVVRAMYN